MRGVPKGAEHARLLRWRPESKPWLSLSLEQYSLVCNCSPRRVHSPGAGACMSRVLLVCRTAAGCAGLQTNQCITG